jgi:hypothetical protein
MKKDDPKKKKKLPFYGRAYGGAARRRADRKAYRRGGSVKPTTELLSPNEPKAPASGKVEQHFKKGGVAKRQSGGVADAGPGEEERSAGIKKLAPAMASESRSVPGRARPFANPRTETANVSRYVRPDLKEERGGYRRGGGVKKRADGGPSDSDAPTKPPRSSSVDDLTTAGLKPLLPALGAGDLSAGLGAGAAPPMAAAGTPGGAPGPVPASIPSPPTPPLTPGVPGMRRGGGVKKRQSGGDVREPRGGFKPPDKPTSWPSDLKPPPRGGAQVPNLGELEKDVKQPGIGSAVDWAKKKLGYKDGGRLTAAQRQSLPKSDFALPGRGSGPKGAGSGSYPIPDRSHAANALARSSGKPVAAQVRAKVKAKYPDMGD